MGSRSGDRVGVSVCQDGAMSELWVVRHGATQWSRLGQHTGLSDVPLLPEGESAAAALAPRLSVAGFTVVLTSPLQRARRTAELAGFPDARPEPLAVEWDYGAYEGLTRAQIREQVPDWSAWDFPAMPAGEHLDEVAKRADTLLDVVRSVPVGPVLLFAHGHFLRVLAARHLDQPPTLGRHLALDPATVSVLGLDRGTPVITRWNS